jgi:biotin carboxylase
VNEPLTVAIVDADGIGAFLPGALARYGARAVHVRSDAPNIHFARRPADLEIEVVHQGDLARTAAALREHGVGFVVAGTESGVLLADALSVELGTPGNGMTRPVARRDKYEMVAAVAQAGLATAASMATDSVRELLDWAGRLGTWPAVRSSRRPGAGSDYVLFCRSPEELREGFASVLGAVDRYGCRNTAVVGQQFLEGEEYFVNTVSRNGVHHLVEVWRYQKRLVDGGRSMYDYEEPVAPQDPVGAPARRTVDLGSSPGYLYLSAPEWAEVEADYRSLRQLEEAGLYQPAVLAASDHA